MKKLLLILLFASHLSFAQQIPNGDFEAWSTQPGSFFPSPTGWITSAMIPNSITKVEGITNGTFALKLATVPFQDTVYSSGAILSFSIKNAPSKISGYYKSNTVQGDSAALIFTIGSYKGAAAGIAEIVLGGDVNTFTYFEAPVEILANEVPFDTASIFLTITNEGDVHAGSSVVFDQLTLHYNVTGLAKTETSEVRMYPNPASNYFTIENEKGFQEYQIQNLTGTTLLAGSLVTGANRVELHNMAAGSYVLVTRSAESSYASVLIVK